MGIITGCSSMLMSKALYANVMHDDSYESAAFTLFKQEPEMPLPKRSIIDSGSGM
jgi:hypothetical protein